MKYFVPMLLLIGVVALMGNFNKEGYRATRAVLFGIGFLMLVVVIFGVIVAQAL